MSVEYWIWLQVVLGYGSSAVGRVISQYGTAENFYKAPDSEKIVRCRLSKSQTARLHSVTRKEIAKIIKDSAKSGINIITPEDSVYPERLLNITDPPAVLYVKGSRYDFNGNPAVAIVGPRKISDYGAGCGRVIANTLASCGFTVVSGGAVGGDSAAHNGAMEAGGYTIGVLGCGIEYDYLKVNAGLRENITHNGCLVSEYPPYEKVIRGSFPKRNRIISGLSNAVVVLEGNAESGALITARHALEQGRDVFVIPGSPTLPQYEGSNRLIADGARPLLNVNDIINEYISLYPDKIHSPVNKAVAPKTEKPQRAEKVTYETTEFGDKRATANPDTSMLSEQAVAVLNVCKTFSGNFTPDDAVENTELSAGTVLGAVTELEICGFIEALPGGRYRLK